MPKLLIFGLGYAAQILARRLMSKGWDVVGTVRTPEKKAELERQGFKAVLFDAVNLDGVTHVLVSTPPNEQGDPAYNKYAKYLQEIKWLGYLSTTGVYGDHQGAWVDETTACAPTNDRGHQRLQAEQQWLSTKLPVHIFRLAGIYGPSRNALDQVKAGMACRIYKQGQVFSRVHVEDIVNALEASMVKPNPGTIYNVCDDLSCPPQDVIAYACRLLGQTVLPLIPIDRADISPMAASFYADNKRVHNDRIKKELGVRLIYPTYREGLRSLID